MSQTIIRIEGQRHSQFRDKKTILLISSVSSVFFLRSLRVSSFLVLVLLLVFQCRAICTTACCNSFNAIIQRFAASSSLSP